MIFSVQYFGMGAGIVVAGWFAGMCVNVVFSAFRSRV